MPVFLPVLCFIVLCLIVLYFHFSWYSFDYISAWLSFHFTWLLLSYKSIRSSACQGADLFFKSLANFCVGYFKSRRRTNMENILKYLFDVVLLYALYSFVYGILVNVVILCPTYTLVYKCVISIVSVTQDMASFCLFFRYYQTAQYDLDSLQEADRHFTVKCLHLFMYISELITSCYLLVTSTVVYKWAGPWNTETLASNALENEGRCLSQAMRLSV